MQGVIQESNRKKGLTLVELMVAVAVIVLIAVVSIVSFSILTPRRLEAEARKIVSDLCWARQMAVAKHQNYIVDFEAVNERYFIYETSIAPGNLIKRQDLEVDLFSVDSNPVVFNSPGGTTQDNRFELRYRGGQRGIIVFGETGYVRIE